MGSSKRASMREGPLAALFRKTEEDGLEPRAEERAPEPEPEPVREPEPAPDPEARGHVPHPSLDPSAPAAPAERAQAAPPSARERLNRAFSPDIPDDILEVPGERDPYAQAASSAGASRAPVGSPSIRVVGVGGAGVNAVNRMVEAEVEGIDFIAVNTDLQSLQQSAAQSTLHIGDGITRGLGSGSDPELGRAAAKDDYDAIKAMLKGADMVFIAAGAGGGTGTGAAPVVAKVAREVGALVVGIVTKPFGFEGTRRRTQADSGVEALAAEVDTLIVVPNDRLLSVLEKGTSMVEAFRVADDVLRQGVQGIADLVTLPGLINLDFADVRTIMTDAGSALLGIGMGSGERRAIDAAEQAVASPLLETSMDGARSILLSITGGNDLSLWEVNEAAKAVSDAAHPDANIIFGAMVDEKLDDQVWVTVVATGYAGERSTRQARREVRDALREPAGEPRVERRTAPRRSSAGLDVPEFIPRA